MQDLKASSEAKTCCVYIDYTDDSCPSHGDQRLRAEGTHGWCPLCVKGYLLEDDLVNHLTVFHSYRETTETPSDIV